MAAAEEHANGSGRGHRARRQVNQPAGCAFDELSARYPVDSRRIYATGMSNGAMMSHRLGIELSDRIAAIAPVVGTLFDDEPKPPHAVPALMINGMLTFWAKADGCSSQTREEQSDRWFLYRSDCRGHDDVQLYLVKDDGHAWPGGQPGSRRGDTPSAAMNATDVIWDFFAQHPKRAVMFSAADV